MNTAALSARVLLHNRSNGRIPRADHVEYCGRGRGSVLGNPFTGKAHTRVRGTTVVASRDEAIRLHRDWLREQLRARTPVYDRIQALAARVANGQTVVLECWCRPLACHTETLKEAVMWYAARGERHR